MKLNPLHPEIGMSPKIISKSFGCVKEFYYLCKPIG